MLDSHQTFLAKLNTILFCQIQSIFIIKRNFYSVNNKIKFAFIISFCYIIKKEQPMFQNMKFLTKRFIKFCTVGAVGMVVGLGTLYIFVDFFHFNKYVAWLPSTVLSILSNFIWNNLFTWADQRVKLGKRFFKKMALYYLLTFISLGINYIIYYSLLRINIYYMYAALGGIAAATFLNFFFSNNIVWRKS